MLSFNNKSAWGTVSNDGGKFRDAKTNATLWEFTYTKNQNKKNIDKLIHKQDFDINKQGTIVIDVTKSGYRVTETTSQKSFDINISGMSVDKNSIGFFTDHYKHSCSQCGYFEIKNISLIVTSRKGV